MKELESIKDDLKKNQLKPFYVLDGEEPYYIDLLTDYLEEHVLQPSERDFNKTVFYGKDTEVRVVLNECRSYPVFASRRLVIVKEAQSLKDFTLLESYFQNPAETTVLVIAYKYKKVDGRSNASKLIKKFGAYFSFEKIRDYKLGDWIVQYCASKKRKISEANAELIAAHLGTDLQKVANEIDKAAINIQEGQEISEEIIERYIGISKDYNIFQYPAALLEKDVEKAYKIIQYYMANSKDFHMVPITANVYSQFSRLYQFHYVSHLPQNEVATVLKISPFFVKDYQKAARFYNLAQTQKVIHLVYEYNLNAVGMNIAKNDLSLLKEMTAKILSA